MRIDFALRLPGFTLPIMKYWDGQGLRLVLLSLSLAVDYPAYVFAPHSPYTAHAKPSVFCSTPNPLFLCREEQKRSHTLRYVLKNRKTNKVLLVVLFTLYLNEDLDEQGNVKPGVEAGLPFDKMAKEKAAKHDSKRGDVADESSREGSVADKKENEKFYEGDDDVD